MLKPYDLLEGVLGEIERGLKDGINENVLADKYYLSQVHLRRLFKFAFRRTIGAYIRSRKLAASVEDLLNTDMKVLNIALEYGFGYEQTYIRAFKHEFGLTPGELRKSGQIVKIMPPLQLFDFNRLWDGLIFGPEIVIIPQFHTVGRKHKLPFRDALTLPTRLVDEFLKNKAKQIQGRVNPNAYINISSEAGGDADYCYFMPSVQVKTLDDIPKGLDSYTFPTSLCARFRYISVTGDDMNMASADEMFDAIDNFMADEKQQYFLERKRINFDRFDSSVYDGCLIEWEWFSPVVRKTENDTPKNPDGIIKTYKQEIPALRFVGKKRSEPLVESVFDTILDHFDNWRLDYTFDAIEKKSGKDLKTWYEGADAYISLMRKKGNELEYWLGMFLPPKTEVPEGYEAIDFPKSAIGVCRVYGKRNAIIHYDADCRKKLAEEGICKRDDAADSKWFFQRFNWHRFFEEDRYGKRLLDYCYFI